MLLLISSFSFAHSEPQQAKVYEPQKIIREESAHHV